VSPLTLAVNLNQLNLNNIELYDDMKRKSSGLSNDIPIPNSYPNDNPNPNSNPNPNPDSYRNVTDENISDEKEGMMIQVRV
jgi:hypothetical protein